MRLLADENIPGMLIRALRDNGVDVLWILESHRGDSDRAILDLARGENRILLTCDKDFGELAFHQHLPAGCGVILLRVAMIPSVDCMATLAAILASRTDWGEHFSVVETDRIRMRSLPSAP
ncbi:MAG: DUF5615 family PIN-like protein [Acidobacteria bacterium]|nr:DUF5615 family PIN-like protein [Acidobacteriota bacterium]